MINGDRPLSKIPNIFVRFYSNWNFLERLREIMKY